MSEGTLDNRRYKRLRADLDVKFENISMTQDQVNCLEGVIDNISIGGVFIKTRHPFPINTIMKLEFDVPGQNKTVKAVGMVRWIGKSDDTRGMGIRFIKVTTTDKVSIHQYVEENSAPMPAVKPGEPKQEWHVPPELVSAAHPVATAPNAEMPQELFKRLPYNASIQRVMGFYIGEIDNVYSIADIASKSHVDNVWLEGVFEIFEHAGVFRREGAKIRFVNPANEDTWKKLVEWAVEFVAVGEDTTGRFDRFFGK